MFNQPKTVGIPLIRELLSSWVLFSLAFKKQVDQIFLISGDSDFVPAAKMARREGIDFILDPMGAVIKDDLFEHIDGLESLWNAKPNKRSKN